MDVLVNIALMGT